MDSPTKANSKNQLNAENLAALLLVCTALHLVEGLLPKFPLFPWLRLGLSYLVILPVLIRFGVKEAAGLMLGRNFLALFYGGQLFSSFLISSLSGLTAFFLAGLLIRRFIKSGFLGWMGAGILMSAVFNVSQLALVDFFYVAHAGLYFQLPFLLGWSAVSGALVAAAACRCEGSLRPFFQHKIILAPKPWLQAKSGFGSVYVVLLTFLLVCLFLIPWYQVQAIAVCFLLPFAGRNRIKTLLLSWPFFLYLFYLHLFQTDGVFIFRDWITREGLMAFAFYGLRTLNIILIGQYIAAAIQPAWFRRFRHPIIRGTVLALPHVPALFGIAISCGKGVLHQLAKGNFNNSLEPVVTGIQKILQKVEVGSSAGRPG